MNNREINIGEQAFQSRRKMWNSKKKKCFINFTSCDLNVSTMQYKSVLFKGKLMQTDYINSADLLT